MDCFARQTRCARLIPLLLSLASVVGVGHAQGLGPSLRVNVPFDFESGSRHFAAGSYLVRVESDHRLTLEGASDRLITNALPDESRDIATKSTVVFRRYGDRYFLREVWTAGRRTHIHCLPTKAEKQMEVALKAQRTPGVSVALLDSPK